jgi:hypothetical protein
MVREAREQSSEGAAVNYFGIWHIARVTATDKYDVAARVVVMVIMMDGVHRPPATDVPPESQLGRSLQRVYRDSGQVPILAMSREWMGSKRLLGGGL